MALSQSLDFRHVQASGRLDAEYFSPAYMRLEEACARLNADTIGSIAAHIRRGVQPLYDADGTVPVLRTVNIRELDLSEARQEFVNEKFANENSRGRVRQGDILITSTGIGVVPILVEIQ